MISFEINSKRFLQITKMVPISAKAQTLYFHLLNTAEERFWSNELAISNQELYTSTNLSRQELTKARQELQTLGFVHYSNGSGSSAGKYTIIDIESYTISDINKELKNITISGAENTTLKQIQKNLDYLPYKHKVQLKLIYDTLEKAIKNNQSGIYNNQYVTAMEFLQAENNLTESVIAKLILMLENKEISNKPAYIMAVIGNFLKQRRAVA